MLLQLPTNQMLHRFLLAGVSGPVFIDENGDRALSLQMKNFHNGKMPCVASYFRLTGKLEYMGTAIVWPGGSVKAPLGRPKCGFDSELCPSPGIKNVFIFHSVYHHLLMVKIAAYEN